MAATSRTGPERKADALVKLGEHGADTWVATASEAGVAHLVPLSFAWTGDRILLATPRTTLTVRNIEASGRARLAFGDTHDVVIVDAELDRVVEAADLSDEIGDAYARQAGWDPRRSHEHHAVVLLRPRRIQAWRRENEFEGRVIMSDGRWLF